MSYNSEHNIYFDKLIQNLKDKNHHSDQSNLDSLSDDNPNIDNTSNVEDKINEVDPNYFGQNGKYYDPKVYILNPESGKFVLRSGKIGRKLIYGDNPPPESRRASSRGGGGKVSKNHRVYSIRKMKKTQENTDDYQPFYNRTYSTDVKIRKLKRGEYIDSDTQEILISNHSPSLPYKKEHCDHSPESSDNDKNADKLISKDDHHRHRRHNSTSQQELRDEIKRSKAIHKINRFSSSGKKHPDQLKNIIYLYTDGSVSHNKRGHKNARGGIGVYFGHKNDPRNISEPFLIGPITNQRAEIWACVRALEIIRDEINLDETKVVIYSDSMYAINILTRQWKAKDNLDIIKIAWSLMIPGIVFKHIRAHTGKKDKHSVGNSWADRLANQGKEIK